MFALNNRKILSISKIEDLADNSKKIRLTFSENLISKGNRFTYVLGDNYFLTSKPYSGPWLVDKVTVVGAFGFTSVLE